MADTLLAEADRAAGAADFERAIELLTEIARKDGADPALWLRIAAMQRARGDAGAALDAVHRALTFAPLDFTALLMRASLLQRSNDPGAGEAWAHALAQRPDGGGAASFRVAGGPRGPHESRDGRSRATRECRRTQAY